MNYSLSLIILYIFVIKGEIIDATLSLSSTSTMETDNQYIYISSTASKDVFPHNTSYAFENVISPLMLDPSMDYEVALVNFLHPKNYYSIIANDNDFSIQFISVCDNSAHPIMIDMFKYVPKFSMLGHAREPKIMIDMINKDITEQIAPILGVDAIQKYMPQGRLLIYDWETERVRVEIIVHAVGDGREARCHPDMAVRFSPRLAHILGFSEKKIYRYYVPRTVSVDYKWLLYNQNVSMRPPRNDGGVDFIYVYSDIVVPCRFAGQQVNILDAFALQGSSTKGYTPTLYKQLLNKTLNSVGVRITDQNGYPIVFEEGRSITLILHIRSR